MFVLFNDNLFNLNLVSFLNRRTKTKLVLILFIHNSKQSISYYNGEWKLV